MPVPATQNSRYCAGDIDIDVAPVDDPSYTHPWVAVEPNGTVHNFDTEMHACIFQRGWRAAKGLDIMTGEPL